MSCDFKPGDEVVCVDAEGLSAPLQRDGVYLVDAVGPCSSLDRKINNTVSVFIVGVPNPSIFGGHDLGFWPRRFRKVERRNDSLSIEAFLTIKPGQFEEPRRTKAPAKKRERAS